MSRAVLFTLPVVAVLVIAFALFGVGAPRPYGGIRVFGGPTEGVTVLAWRVAVIERLGEVEQPAAINELELELTLGDGRKAMWRGDLDALGMCAPRVELGARVARVAGAPIAVTARAVSGETSEPLGGGRVELGIATWRERARRIGGFIASAPKGDLVIRAALSRGVLAVPFVEQLLIEVRDARGPVAGVGLELDPEGLDFGSGVTRLALVTDARGRAEARVAPREHNVALRIRAKAADGRTGEWYSMPYVVPGALHAELVQGKLRILSPILRDVAFYALINENGRLAGGPVKLEPDGRGGAVALFEPPPLPAGPLWAVVSAEPELDSGGTVGWPLRPDPSGEPRETLTIPDQLLLDTVPQGFARDSERRKRARWLAGVFTALSAALAWALLISRARAAQAALEQHFARAGEGLEGVERAAGRGLGLGLLIAALCLGLGFTIVALVAIYRIG
jgi:hypothetical protein